MSGERCTERCLTDSIVYIRIEYVQCECVRVSVSYFRFILSRKCQMHNERNSQFWCNWQPGFGVGMWIGSLGGCLDGCLNGMVAWMVGWLAGSLGSLAMWSYHKMSNLFAVPVVRVLANGNIWTKCLLIWQAIWQWHDVTMNICDHRQGHSYSPRLIYYAKRFN